MSLPPLASLHFFSVAAENESFVEAARRLHVTHGAVSRQVRQLEEALGVALFERRNRAIFLNEAGRTLQGLTRPFFEQLQDTVYQLQRDSRDEVLVVSCEPTIAMKWLIPRLPQFQTAHPGVQLQLLAAGGPIDFARSGADVAIRRDDFQWGDSIHAQPLCQEWIGPVCAPSVWAQTQSLEGLCLLRSKTRLSAWDGWLALSGTTLAQSVTQDFEHFYLCIQAATAGLGVSLSSRLMVQDELASGQLVAPFGFRQDGSQYCLLSPRPLHETSKCQVFFEWLRQQMASSGTTPHL